MDDFVTPTLTPAVARERLGLGAGEDLSRCKIVEARLAKLAATATNTAARASFERDLAELRKLLRVVENEATPAKSGSGILMWALVLVLICGGGYWGYRYWQENGLGERENVVNLNQTEDRFEEALEKRRWEEAENLVELLEAGGASAAKVGEARARVEEGRVEERGQQIAFLVSNAQSALEAGQLLEAETFIAKVEELQPGHPKVAEFRSVIEENKMEVRTRSLVRKIEKALRADDLETAGTQLEALVKADATHAKIPELRKRLATAKAEMRERRAKAEVLIAKARALDKGTYSAEALALVEEAMRLDPSDENRALYQRMSAYGKVIKVPDDFPTITAALKAAEKNDRVFVAKGTYQESLLIPAGVELVGENRGETVIECPAKIGSVITVGSGEGEVRIASLTLRHSGLVNDDERFAIVMIDGAQAEMNDVSVKRASGHGIAVLNGGLARLIRCKVSDCGWDGIAVTGEKSRVTLNEVSSEKNLHHGIDFWDGASGSVTASSLLENGRAGLLAILPSQPVVVEKTKSEKNREVGFLFSDAKGVTLTECEVHENLLGGIVFDNESSGVALTNNRVTKNGEAGIVFEKGVTVAVESGNVVKDNLGKQIWKNAVFPKSTGERIVSPPPPAPPLDEGGGTPKEK